MTPETERTDPFPLTEQDRRAMNHAAIAVPGTLDALSLMNALCQWKEPPRSDRRWEQKLAAACEMAVAFWKLSNNLQSRLPAPSAPAVERDWPDFPGVWMRGGVVYLVSKPRGSEWFTGHYVGSHGMLVEFTIDRSRLVGHYSGGWTPTPVTPTQPEAEPKRLDTGVWFQSAVSGLKYQSPGAAGSISCVMVNGERFYPKPPKEPANAG